MTLDAARPTNDLITSLEWAMSIIDAYEDHWTGGGGRAADDFMQAQSRAHAAIAAARASGNDALYAAIAEHVSYHKNADDLPSHALRNCPDITAALTTRAPGGGGPDDDDSPCRCGHMGVRHFAGDELSRSGCLGDDQYECSCVGYEPPTPSPDAGVVDERQRRRLKMLDVIESVFQRARAERMSRGKIVEMLDGLFATYGAWTEASAPGSPAPYAATTEDAR